MTACFLAAMILLGRVAATPPQTDRSPAPETASVEQHQGVSGAPPRDPAAPAGGG